VRENGESPDEGVIYPWRELSASIYDIEDDIERGPTRLHELLKEILERIIEKRLEYYGLPKN